MRLSAARVRAISRKELREYRRNRQLVVTMAVLPLVFIITPAVQIFTQPASAAGTLAHEQVLVYMLAIPAIVPATFAVISVAGERQQGTLEPVLTTPIRRDEFLLGKALAALVPAISVSYAVLVPVSQPHPGRARRRVMRVIMAHRIMASWWAGRRS
jgi:ABC-type Na+ efflux pump permease subunit